MNNKKKVLWIVVALIIVLAVVIVLAVSCHNGTGESETTTANNAATEEITLEDLVIPSTDENGSYIIEETTQTQEDYDPWEDVEVIPGDVNSKNEIDENGIIVDENYPGEDQGWSPIVSPEDLE